MSNPETNEMEPSKVTDARIEAFLAKAALRLNDELAGVDL